MIFHSLQAQIDWKREILPNTAFFLAGSMDGLAENLKFHYWEFQEKHPNANPQYWNPAISYTNKYANGNSQAGPAFPFSTTTLVWLTDGYHLMRFNKLMLFTAGILLTPDIRGQRWYVYLAKAAMYSLAYSAGFHLTYSIIYS